MRFLLFFSLFWSCNLLAQQWVALNNIPSARHHPVTWGLNGKGYMLTGTIPPNTVTKDFYEYNPAADLWTQKADFPGVARSFSIGTVYNGKGYMGFGASQSNYLRDLWEYDPVNDSWRQLADCPCAGRRHPAFIAVNDKLFVGLGDGATGDLNDWWEYDMATDSWTQRLALPASPRHHPFQFAINGQAYTGLGHSGSIIFGDWHRFDPVNRTWTTLNPFPGEARVAGTQFDYNGKGYVLSGDGDNHSWMPTGEFWEYDASLDVWTALPPHPGISRWAPGSFIIGSEVYFLGGTNRQLGSFPNDFYKYDLAGGSVGLVEDAESMVLYPNPMQTKARIAVDAAQLLEWQVMDIHGRIIGQGNTAEIAGADWPAGLYVVHIVLRNGRRQSIRLQKVD